MNRRIGKTDILFLIIVAILLILSTMAFRLFHRTVGDYILVEYDGAVIDRISLSQDVEKEILLENDRFYNIVQVKDHRAYVTDANCPDKLCVHQSGISRDGETIVCLPHKLVIAVYGTEDMEYDAIAQ